MSFFSHRSPWLLKQGFSVPWISPSRLDWLASESPGILCLPLPRMRIENTDHHTQHHIHEFRGLKAVLMAFKTSLTCVSAVLSFMCNLFKSVL